MDEKKILITYSTMSGSTQEIAEFVASEFTRLGQSVELHPCREINDLKPFSSIVIGAPMYMFRLHNDIQRFLQRHHKSLANLPAAFFAGGVYGPNVEQDELVASKNLESELSKYEWFKPVSVQLVGGRFDPNRLRFPYNLIPTLKQNPACDARNWEEIRAWVNSLPALLANPVHGILALEGKQ